MEKQEAAHHALLRIPASYKLADKHSCNGFHLFNKPGACRGVTEGLFSPPQSLCMTVPICWSGLLEALYHCWFQLLNKYGHICFSICLVWSMKADGQIEFYWMCNGHHQGWKSKSVLLRTKCISSASAWIHQFHQDCNPPIVLILPHNPFILCDDIVLSCATLNIYTYSVTPSAKKHAEGVV